MRFVIATAEPITSPFSKLGRISLDPPSLAAAQEATTRGHDEKWYNIGHYEDGAHNQLSSKPREDFTRAVTQAE